MKSLVYQVVQKMKFLAIGFLLVVLAMPAQAQFNQQINYQGKLVSNAGVAVPNGNYPVVFKLYTVATSGAAIWTENRFGVNQVVASSGLFSVMLGSVSSLAGVDFNQPLYLGVTVASDTEMVPRKIFGALPAAFEAKNAQTLSGLATTSFVRTDQDSLIASTTANSLLTIIQNGTGNILDLLDGVVNVFTVRDGGNVGIGTTTPGAKLTVGGSVYVAGNITATGTLAITGTSTLGTTTVNYLALTQALGSGSGGTGFSSYVTGDFLYASALPGSPLTKRAIGTTGQILSVVAGVPDWVSTSTLGFGSAFTNSAQLAALLSDETGSAGGGLSVFSNGPTFTGLTAFASTTASDGYYLGGLTAIAGSTTARNFFMAGASSTTFTSGTDNYGIGRSVFNNLSSGTYNIAGGESAVRYLTSGFNNVAFGRQALQGSSTGFMTGSDNNALGGFTLNVNNTGSFNNAFGYLALYANTSGSYNNAFGRAALVSNTSGLNNTAIGQSAMNTNTTGSYNIAIGYNSLYFNTNGSYNNVMGSGALYSNVGTGTIAIGYQAADNALTVDRGIFIGYNIDPSSNSADDVLNIGNIIFGTAVDGQGTTLSSGNIGIGTSTPSSRLTVGGAGYFAGNLTATGTLAISGTSTLATTTISSSTITNLTLMTALDVLSGGTGFNSYATGDFLYASGLNTLAKRTIGSTGDILSVVAGVPTWVATSTLGIGGSSFTNSAQLAALLSDETGSAGGGLSVFSNGPTFTGLTTFTGTTTLATSTFSGTVSLGSQFINNDGGSNEGLQFDTTGRGKFVTTSGSVSNIMTLSNISTGIGTGLTLEFDANNVTHSKIQATIEGASAASALSFYTRGGGVTSERMRISSNGNVGIGTTSSSSLLTVAGTVNITGTTTINNLTLGQALDGGNGGTGLSTIVQNQLLIGGTGNTWSQISTSSLGLAAAFSNSAQLAALLSDETGTGSVVYSDTSVLTGTTTAANLVLSGRTVLSALVASRALFLDGTKGVTTSGTSLGLSAALSDETGSGAVVFDTAPTFTTNITAPLVLGGAAVGSTLTLQTTSGVGTTDAIIFKGGNNGATLLGTLDLGSTNNVAFGANAGATFSALTTYNVALGFEAGRYASTTAADDSMYIGRAAGRQNMGAQNNLVGYFAGYNNTGNANNIFGASAGYNNTGSSSNLFGEFAGYNNTGSLSNIFGESAGRFNTGSQNNLFGDSAGRNNTGAQNNLFGNSAGRQNIGQENNIFGSTAGYWNTGSQNNFFGNSAGVNNTGSYNNYFGPSAGSDATGSNNNAFGRYAGRNTTGSYSELFGFEAGGRMSASYSVAIGGLSLRGGSGNSNLGNTATTTNNTVIGYGAGYNLLTGGDNNILLGYQAGDNMTIGNNNIVIGYDIDSVTATADNVLNIGNLIFGNGVTGTGTALSSGNIGIGTSTPVSKLTVGGAGYFAGNLTATGSLAISGTSTLATTTVTDFSITQALRDSASSAGTLGMVLQTTGTSTRWVATSTLGISGGASTFLALTDTPSSFTANRIMYTNGAANALVDSANFTYDGTTFALGGNGQFSFNGKLFYASSTSNALVFGREAYRGVGVGNNGISIGERGLWQSTAAAESNIAIGNNAGENVTSGSYNLLLGPAFTGSNITTGNFNTFIGYAAGSENRISSGLTFVGFNSGNRFREGSNNVFVGGYTARYLATSTDSAIFGDYAAYGQSGVDYEATGLTVMGVFAGYNLQSGANNNTLFGRQSGFGVTTGANNILVGYQAGKSLTTGSNNIALGYDIDFPSNTASNQLNIGNIIFGTGINGAGTTLSSGNIGIGTTSPVSKLSLQVNSFSAAGTAGFNRNYIFTNSASGTAQFGELGYIRASSSATSTIVGSMFRVEDSTIFGNTVRGLEVQTNRGTNTQGENTALSGFARTFGVRGYSSGDAGSSFEPAGGFFETGGTTQGNAIRGYSSTITTSKMLSLFQDTSAFSGTGLLMNFGNAGGTFTATTSKFVDLQNAGTSRFTISAFGTTTIGDGTTNKLAGLQIGFGGLCVDNDGSCTASTSGRISSVSSATGNSDLAEMYFSSDNLLPGEVVYTKGNLSVGRATSETKDKIIGVVSTKPGVTMGFDDKSLTPGETGSPIALTGRVPIRLSNENGEIKVGDELMLSSLPGVAMKATGTGAIIGVALEDFDSGRAYSDTYVNQFGDDIIDPIFKPVTEITDTRINDGCYFGGGNATGEEVCVPLRATTTDARIAEAAELAAKAARQAALNALTRKASQQKTLASGDSVRIGQIVMFVDLRYRYLDERNQTMLASLLMSSDEAIDAIVGSENTVWGKLVTLAHDFVDGVLSVVGLKADKIETKELCVDDVCVTADDLRQLLEQNGQSGTPSEPSTPDSTPDPEDSDGPGEDMPVVPPPEQTPGDTPVIPTVPEAGGGAPEVEAPAVETPTETPVETSSPSPGPSETSAS